METYTFSIDVLLVQIALFFGTIAYLVHNLTLEGVSKDSPIKRFFLCVWAKFDKNNMFWDFQPAHKLLFRMFYGWGLYVLFAGLFYYLHPTFSSFLQHMWRLLPEILFWTLLLQCNALIGCIGLCIGGWRIKRKSDVKISLREVFTEEVDTVQKDWSSGDRSVIIAWIIWMFFGVFWFILLTFGPVGSKKTSQTADVSQRSRAPHRQTCALSQRDHMLPE